MKTTYFLKLILFIFFISVSCSKNDSPELVVLENVIGEVLGTTSCGGNNGQAYEISVTILNDVDFIVTGTLPEEFKQQELKIQFDMTSSMEGISECTANFTEPVFYKVINVKISQ